ncbi:hypothetical protein [Cognatiluteimonas profundi]|uniref:hypothetical protein n=1 Tax=Cognatiluteimonas profundi TaxID=2594501 RepID=UPI00131B1B3E|nr:hypothetical protein [Lysobacter profundi]
MRLLVLICSLLMPLVAWFSQRGAFGPTNGAVSDRYPTLVVAAGYAFAIWGLIFLLDIAYGIRQSSASRRADATLARIAPFAAAGFALTAAWMPLFSMGLFWLCLLVIAAALACLLHCTLVLARAQPSPAWANVPLSLHAGWLALAAFLNLAQVIVAYQLLPTQQMLGWSLALFALAAALLLVLNARMRGNVVFVAAAAWALVAVYVKQSQWQLPGASVAAWVALAIVLLLMVQLLWLRTRSRRVADDPSVASR